MLLRGPTDGFKGITSHHTLGLVLLLFYVYDKIVGIDNVKLG